VTLANKSRAGILDVANSPYVLETLKKAGEGLPSRKGFDAIVTRPVHKGGFCVKTGRTFFFQAIPIFFKRECRSPHVVIDASTET